MDTKTISTLDLSWVTQHVQQLVAIPSFSKEEQDTADFIAKILSNHGIPVLRDKNNVWAKNKHFDAGKPTLLLNSHHDTVKPNANYTRDPHDACVVDDKLYGLGSNDAGGALICLLANFLHFYEQAELKYNLIFAATTEEEISGKDGIARILPQLGEIDAAIVGEPTQMHMAVAEKGLLVIDAYAKGKPGHAAHYDNENAIEVAVRDIRWLQQNYFEDVSELLGPVKTTVTQIQAGTQHNVVPGECHFVIDVRTNEKYTNKEVFEILQRHLHSSLKARSFRLNSSGIASDHDLVLAAQELGITRYGSPTISDQALMPFPSIKMGPGVSQRSHTADEFITLHELTLGLKQYHKLLTHIL